MKKYLGTIFLIFGFLEIIVLSAISTFDRVMYEDTNESGKVLQIIDEVFAGESSNKEVTAGTAIKIMTGAPIPKGANAVIKKEMLYSLLYFGK